MNKISQMLTQLPWIILLLLGLFSLGRGLLHIFAPDSGAGIIAGMDLSYPNAADVIFLLGGVGVLQAALGVFYIWIATKARMLIPFVLWVEVIRSASLLVMEYFFKAPANPVPGRYGHLAVFLLALIALLAQIWTSRRQAQNI